MHATSEESNDSSESRIEHQAEDGLNNSQPIKDSKPDVTGKESQPPSDSADNDIEDDALLIDEPDIDNDEIVSSDDDHIISGTGVAHIEQILGGTIIEQTDLK